MKYPDLFFKLPLLVFVFLLSACAAPMNQHISYDAAEQAQAPVNGRLIIKSASMTLVVEDIAAASGGVKAVLNEAEGYVDSSDDEGDKPRRLSLRVPAVQFDKTVQRLGTLGEVSDQNIRTQDVTSEIVDYEARLANLIALRERMKVLLNRAEKIEDILVIEKEISRLQTEIDTYEGRRKVLRQQVALSEIRVTLEKKVTLGPLGYIGWGLYWAVSKLFVIE
jgi:hypothetical protein